MKVIVTVPTYNEAENIRDLVRDIRALGEEYEVVVADDTSPDGTWQLVEAMSQEDPKVHLLLRKERPGRGSAGADAFRFAVDHGADQIVEMDADYSHHPKHIPEMLAALDEHDLVLGSRGVEGGGETGRGAARRIITKLANIYIRSVLGVRVRDCNSGFRAYRRRVFDRVVPEDIQATGPAIVQEVLYKCHMLGLSIGEVPILFVDRERGSSKLDLRRLIRGYTTVLRLRWLAMTGRLFQPR